MLRYKAKHTEKFDTVKKCKLVQSVAIMFVSDKMLFLNSVLRLLARIYFLPVQSEIAVLSPYIPLQGQADCEYFALTE